MSSSALDTDLSSSHMPAISSSQIPESITTIAKHRIRAWTPQEDSDLIQTLASETRLQDVAKRFSPHTFLALIKRIEYLVRSGRIEFAGTGMRSIVELWSRCNIAGVDEGNAVAQTPIAKRGYSWTLEQDKRLLNAVSHNVRLPELQLRFPAILGLVDPQLDWQQRRLQYAEYTHALGSIWYEREKDSKDKHPHLYRHDALNKNSVPEWIKPEQTTLITFLDHLADIFARDEEDSIAVCEESLIKSSDGYVTWILLYARKHRVDRHFKNYVDKILDSISREDEDSLLCHFLEHRREWFKSRCQFLIEVAGATTDQERRIYGSEIFGMRTGPSISEEVPQELADLELYLESADAFRDHLRTCDETCVHTNPHRLARYLDHFWADVHQHDTLDIDGLQRLLFDCDALCRACDTGTLVGSSLRHQLRLISWKLWSVKHVYHRFHTFTGRASDQVEVLLREYPSPPSLEVSGSCFEILNRRTQQLGTALRIETQSFQRTYPDAATKHKRTMFQHPAVSLALRALSDNGRSRRRFLGIGTSGPLCEMCVKFIVAVNRLCKGRWKNERTWHRQVLYHVQEVSGKPYDWLMPENLPPDLMSVMEGRLMEEVDENLKTAYMMRLGDGTDPQATEGEASQEAITGDKRKLAELGDDKLASPPKKVLVLETDTLAPLPTKSTSEPRSEGIQEDIEMRDD